MRRADRALTERKDIEAILAEAQVCRLGFAVDGEPYVVPLSFGYAWEEDLVLYFHGAAQGRKLDLLRRNPLVCFELESRAEITRGDQACDWGLRYASIIGLGTLEELRDPTERSRGLDRLMAHYGFPGKAEYSPQSLKGTAVLRLRVKELSAKAAR